MTQKYLWLLDGGHAPATAGKRSPKLEDGRQLLEWQFARDVVDRIAKRLSELGVAHHVLTPKTVYDLKPSRRAALANTVAASAELPARLISVHANAAGKSGWSDANGITVLYYHGSVLGKPLARDLQTKLVAALGWRNRGIKSRDDLSILEMTNMPAILSENGFYTNREEVETLLSLAGRQQIADAHVQFIAAQEAI